MVEKKILPQALEAEAELLGGCLFSSEIIAGAITEVAAEDFYKPAHREIFRIISSLFQAGEVVDLVTVGNAIREKKVTVDLSYLSSLTDVIPSKHKTSQYCQIITDKSNKRKTIELAANAQHACYQDVPLAEIREQLGQGLLEISGKKTKRARPVGHVVYDVFDEINDTYKNGRPQGLKTGFTDIDKRLGGLMDSDLVVLAARPSMGKTALALNIAENVAQEGNKVLVFSLEMSENALVKRSVSSLGRVDNTRIRNGNLQDSDLSKITRAVGLIESLPIVIDDTSGISITELQARAKMVAAQGDVKLIIVDYLQLLSARAENRTNEIMKISMGLKQVAKDLGVPVLVLSQLNRNLENRTDKRPQLSDLRESGAIEQDADVIMFIYRDEVYNKDESNPNKGLAEVITAKQRNGPTGVDKLVFIGECTRFENYTFS